MKYLLVLAVVVVGAWLWLRARRPPPRHAGGRPRRSGGTAPAEMVGCAHCGLHLPANEAVTDAAGRPFCSDAHRLAGPR
jgi:uncharacterized protein